MCVMRRYRRIGMNKETAEAIEAKANYEREAEQ